jgi:hypothetical protein
MDGAEFLKIAIAALVGAVAKEFISWLVSVFKSARLATSFIASVKLAFAPHNRAVFNDLLIVGFYVGFAVILGWSDEPLSGKRILAVIACLLIASLCFILLLVDLVKAMTINSAAKREKAAK